MYVESDFLFALAKPEDWLKDHATATLESEDVYRRNRPSASGLDPEGEGRKLG